MDDATARVMSEAGVLLTQFSPPRDGLVNLGVDCEWHSSREVIGGGV